MVSSVIENLESLATIFWCETMRSVCIECGDKLMIAAKTLFTYNPSWLLNENSLNEKGIKVVGQKCSTGGAIGGASGELPQHFVC